MTPESTKKINLIGILIWTVLYFLTGASFVRLLLLITTAKSLCLPVKIAFLPSVSLKMCSA